jgi:hypothetical protein
MELEVIPQRVYNYGDGVPAYKSGEWPGKRSSKFAGSKLILKQNRYKIIKENYFPGGVKHFPPRQSEEFKYVSGKKSVPPFLHDDSFRPTRRPIEPLYSELPVHPRNIGIRPPDQIGTDNCAPLFVTKRHYPPLKNFEPEFNVENLMTRKKRIFSLQEQRNLIDVSYPGDKLYRCVENSPDFFKLEGIVVGSTNRINHKKTTRKGSDNFYSTLDLNIKILKPEKLWKSKVINDEIKEQEDYVNQLENWDKVLQEENENNNNNNKQTNKK